MSFVGVSAGIGALSLGTGLVKSISQGRQADAIEKANQRPTYTIPDEFKQNQAMAAQMARVGIPQQQYNNQQNAIQRNQAGGLQAAANSGSYGNIASIVRAGNDANNNLNAQDASARQNNQRYAIEQNGIMGNQELQKQQYDKFDKYTENFNRAQALRGASNTNANNALNGASSLAGGLASVYSPSNNMTFGQMNGTQPLQQAQSAGFGSQHTNPGQVFNPYGSNYTPSAQPMYTNWTPFQ